MKYRRAVVSRAGGPEVFELVEEDLPEPGPGEARIKVQCAGVAFGDVLRRAGRLPGAPKIPYTPGYDMAGIVDAVGPGATGIEVGERVAAFLETGCYAEYVCAPAGLFVHIPDDMDPVISRR